MKKSVYFFVATFLLFATLSCQGSNKRTTPQVTDLTQSQVAPETATPSVLSATTTPDALTDKVNFIPALDGHLYIGPTEKNIYYEFDFDEDRVVEHQLPSDCRLMPKDRKSVCEVRPDEKTTEIYVYDVATEQTDFFVEKDITRWGVSGDGNILLYITWEPNEHSHPVFQYNFETKTQQEVGIVDGNVDKNEKVNIPYYNLISSDFLVGINYEREEWMIAEILPESATSVLNFKSINVAENIAADVYTEWSPNQAMLALVGFYKSDERHELGFLQCLRIVVVYDPYKQNVISTVKAPEQQCFGQIFFTQPVVWAPDSSKFVLFPEQDRFPEQNRQDMCIVTITNLEQGCVSVSIPHKVDYEIRSLSWSPDANYIAYYYMQSFGESLGELWIYSIKEGKSYLVATDGDFSVSYLGHYLIWGQ